MSKKSKREEREQEAIRDRVDRKVRKAIKASGQKHCRVIYSAYQDGDYDHPIDNLDEIAVPGQVVLVRERSEFFGGPRSKDYRSPILENPTWLEICIHVNDSIQVTRDRHHVFYEGLEPRGVVDGIQVFRVIMGS